MPASSSSKTFSSSSSVSSPTTATASSSSRRPDPNRSKGGLESMKLFINLDSLITIHSRKPPAPEEKFFLTGIKNEDDMNLNWLRNLGAPKVFTIENPLSSLTNTNEQDNDPDSSSSSTSFLYNSSKIWVRTRPFADLFAQLVPARVDCLVFSPLPRDLLDAILNQLGWNGFIRSSDVRPVVVGSSFSKESENDFSDENSLLRTLPQIGILPSMNGHLRGLILDSTRSLWHPLLHNQILIIPKQNVAKSLPRFVEPFGILVTMSTVFDVVNLYEASCPGISASQCLSEVQQTRFDSMKVHCPSSSSVATLLSAATSSSSASSSPDIVNYEFLNDKVRMIVSNGGGLTSANKSDANLWLFSGVNKPSNLDAKSSPALVNAYTSVVPEPSCDVSVVRGSYFDACQAFQCPLPPILFSLSKDDLYGPTKLTSTFSNTSSINDLGDTVLPSSTRNEDDSSLQDSGDNNNEPKSSSRHHKSSSSSSTKTTTSKVHTVNLASWWDWISSRSPLPSSNLQTVLTSCSGEEIEEEVAKAIRFNQQKKELYSKMKSDRAEEALSRSADKPSISMEDLHLLSTSDWISSSSLPPSMTPKKIKEDTFFVATWLLARCLAPFSKATAWLPVKTLWQCLTHVKCEPSKSFLGKVFDSTALLSSSDDSAKTSSVRSTSTTKPGLTNFIVSSDGSYIARVSASSKSIHSKYQSSSNNYLNSRSGTVRPGENFSKDSSTATEGDQRARLPPPASVETQTSIDIKTRSIAVQAQLMMAAPPQQQIQQQQPSFTPLHQQQQQQPTPTIVQHQQQQLQPSFSAQRRSREETTTSTTTTSTTTPAAEEDIFAQQYGTDASSSSTTDNSQQTQQPKDFSFDDLLVPANSANSNTKGFKQIQHLHQTNKTEEDDDDIFEKPPTTSSIATRLGKDGKEAPPPPPTPPQAQPPSSVPRGSSGSSSSSSASLLPIPSSSTATATGANINNNNNNFNFIQNNNHINHNNRAFVNQTAVMPTPDELIALQTGCGIGRQNLENPNEWEPLLNHAQVNLRPQGHHKFASTIERAVNYFRQRQMRNSGSPNGGVQRL